MDKKTEKALANVAQPTKQTAPAFLEKLFEILDDKTLEEYISWMPDGKSFIIKKVAEMSELVLPKWFKHNNIQSFVRQLNMYSFSKTRHDSNHREFRQPLFQRGRRDLLLCIKRKSQPSSRNGSTATSSSTPATAKTSPSISLSAHKQSTPAPQIDNFDEDPIAESNLPEETDEPESEQESEETEEVDLREEVVRLKQRIQLLEGEMSGMRHCCNEMEVRHNYFSRIFKELLGIFDQANTEAEGGAAGVAGDGNVKSEFGDRSASPGVMDPAFFRMISLEAEAALASASKAKQSTSGDSTMAAPQPLKSSPLIGTRKSINSSEGGSTSSATDTEKRAGTSTEAGSTGELEQKAKERFLSNPLQGMSLASIASAQRASLDRVNMDFMRSNSMDSGGGLDVIAAAAIYRSTERDAHQEEPNSSSKNEHAIQADLKGRCVSLSVSMDSVRSLKRSLEDMDRETETSRSMNKLTSDMMFRKEGQGSKNGDGLHTLLNVLGDPDKI
jgi:hypothetical protein